MKTYRVTEIAPHTGDDSCSRISESPPQRTPLDLEACVNNGNVFFNHLQPNKKKTQKLRGQLDDISKMINHRNASPKFQVTWLDLESNDASDTNCTG